VNAAQLRARALAARVDTVPGGDAAAFKTQVEALTPVLADAQKALLAASMAMQSADVAPTANQIAACARARAQGNAALARWKKLEATGLKALNARGRAAGPQ
jgi:hypothetical protein